MTGRMRLKWSLSISVQAWSGVAYRSSARLNIQDSKVHEANMGPTWVLSAPDGPKVGPWTLLSGIFQKNCMVVRTGRKSILWWHHGLHHETILTYLVCLWKYLRLIIPVILVLNHILSYLQCSSSIWTAKWNDDFGWCRAISDACNYSTLLRKTLELKYIAGPGNYRSISNGYKRQLTQPIIQCYKLELVLFFVH